MKKLVLFLVIWPLSAEFSHSAESRFDCDAKCPKDYDRIVFGDCVKEGQQCQIHCRYEAQVNAYTGKCVRTH